MREFLFLGKEIGIVAIKAISLVGIVGLVWFLANMQTPGHIPFF